MTKQCTICGRKFLRSIDADGEPEYVDITTFMDLRSVTIEHECLKSLEAA